MGKFLEFINLHDLLIEMSISSKNFKDGIDKIQSYLNKKFGTTLVKMDEVDQFENDEGSFYGVRLFWPNSTDCIRLNFSSTNHIATVDYWGADGGHVPTVHIKFPADTSLVKILPAVVEIIQNEKLGTFYADTVSGKLIDDSGQLEESKMLTEKKVTIDGKEYISQQAAAMELFKQGKSYSDLESIPELSAASIFYAAKRVGIAKPIESTRGKGERKIGKDIESAEKKFADPKIIFDDLAKLVTMVAKGAANSLLVLGQSGIGKTHTVMQSIKSAGLKEEDDYIVIKGFSTAAGMYRTLYINNDKLVIYDDADAVFKDANGVNILKAALDSYEKRVLTWSTMRSFDPESMDTAEIEAALDEGRLPRKFEFTGRIIFISNLPRSKMDAALLTRVIAAPDVTLKNEDIIKRMKDILPSISPEVPMKTKMMVFEQLEAEAEGRDKQLSIRTLVNAIKFANFGIENGMADWKGLIDRHA
jgi:hypothetical protein